MSLEASQNTGLFGSLLRFKNFIANTRERNYRSVENSHEKTKILALRLRNSYDLFRVNAIKMLWLDCAIDSVCVRRWKTVAMTATKTRCHFSVGTQSSDSGTTASLLKTQKTFEVARAWARHSRACAKRTGTFVICE